MFNLYSQRGSIIEKDRIKSQGNILNVPRSDSLLTDQKHKGCLQRINILIQELDRMSEAQKMANLEIQQLQKEIKRLQSGGEQQNQQSVRDEQGKEEELRLEKQKFLQYKQLKEQQTFDLENDLIKIHKELKEEKLIRLDLNHRFEVKCQEIERLKQEIEKLQNQQNPINDGQILNQLHRDLILFQNENKELKQTNMKQQSQLDRLIENTNFNQQLNEQYCQIHQQQQSLEEALFPSTKISPVKKMNRTLTIQPIEPYYNKSLYQSNRLSINYPQQQFKIENNEKEQENNNSYEHQYNSNTKRKEYQNNNNNYKICEDTQRTVVKQYNQF